MTKTIKKYIQFAIANGFNIPDFELDYINTPDTRYPGIYIIYTHEGLISKTNLAFVITSRAFLSAIVKGIWNLAPYGKSKGTKVKMMFPNVGQLNYLNQGELLEDLTFFQAVALRDDNIQEFIDNLGI